MNKAQFLKEKLVPTIAKIPMDFKPLWGKMNVQQMAEHLSREGFQVASGKIHYDLVTPPENVAKMQAFVMSDRPFRENTPNSLMNAEPALANYLDMEDSLDELQQEIDSFFEYYETDKNKTVLNPFFGELNFDMQIHLLYKHALHHLRQFGVIV